MNCGSRAYMVEQLQTNEGSSGKNVGTIADTRHLFSTKHRAWVETYPFEPASHVIRPGACTGPSQHAKAAALREKLSSPAHFLALVANPASREETYSMCTGSVDGPKVSACTVEVGR